MTIAKSVNLVSQAAPDDRFGMTPAVTGRCGAHDYAMVAPKYAVMRRELAKAIGLGRKPASGAKGEAARGKEEGSLSLVVPIEVCVENTDRLVATWVRDSGRVGVAARADDHPLGLVRRREAVGSKRLERFGVRHRANRTGTEGEGVRPSTEGAHAPRLRSGQSYG